MLQEERLLLHFSNTHYSLQIHDSSFVQSLEFANFFEWTKLR